MVQIERKRKREKIHEKKQLDTKTSSRKIYEEKKERKKSVNSGKVEEVEGQNYRTESGWNTARVESTPTRLMS